MDNREDIYVITDKETEISTMLISDQDLFNYTIRQVSETFTTQETEDDIRIETQPDGSWLVNDEPAATPEAVAQILIEEPIIQDVSIHAVALLLASSHSASERAELEYVDLPYDTIDENMLTDIGDLVNEDELETFEGSQFFNEKDFDKVEKKAFFKSKTKFAKPQEAIPYKGKRSNKSNASNEKVKVSVLRTRDPIWGDLGTRTLGVSSTSSGAYVSTDYGNPEPLFAALLELMKIERAAQ